MPRVRPLLVAVACLLSAACVQTNAVRLGASPARPPVKAEHVVIYRTAQQVPGQYEEVALLNASGSTGWTNEEKMYNALRKKAGEMGGNGVILDGVSEPSAGAKVAGAFLGTGTERKGKAIAIYVVLTDSTRGR